MEQLRTIGRELAIGSQGSTWVGGHSKEFLDLVKSIGESRSKTEEDRIVLSELEILKVRLAEPDIPKRKMKEYIIRLIYVEMLGYDASFGYIHAVKMTHDDSLLLKRTGYLAVTLFLREDHDFIMLIINTIQKDLKSDNYLVVCAALMAVCKLINEETIPAVLPQVVELLGHPKEAVRKKAIMALHRFHQRSAYSVTHLISNFRKRLCDSDPGVMGATLCPLFDVIRNDANSYKDLGMSFINILKQVAERRLPRSYDYHQMPAPFIQVKLLKILSLLGSGDRQSSESMYNVVAEVLRKCDSSSNIGNAVLYECICCISSIYPNPQLMETAADAISRFLKSDSHNLRYMGIDALARLININPEYAEQHQLAVIDCLEDPDDTLKRKTFDLLYKMTKSSNVEIIVDRMIEYMISINDNHYKREIASRCVGVAEEFAPHNTWFIQTMTKVFQHAGDLVGPKVPHDLMRLIAEGFSEDAEDSLLQSSAVDSYLRLIGDIKIPPAFLQIIFWVLGEYGTVDSKFSAAHISGKLCELAEAHANDDVVQAYAVTALMKVCAFELASGKKLTMLPECESYIEELSASHSTDLQQRAYEVQALLSLDPNAVNAIMPYNSSCEDITIDEGLPFLDDHVRKCLENGAQAYVPETARLELVGANDSSSTGGGGGGHSLRFEAYAVPKPPPLVLSDSISSEPAFPPAEERAAADPSMKLRLEGVQKKWGRETPSVSVSGKTNGGVEKSRERTAQPRAVSSEKQKLAASLFSGVTVPTAEENKAMKTKKKTAQQPPPPDLLVFGDEVEEEAAVDPFMAIDASVAPSSSYGGFDELLLLQGITPSTEGADRTGRYYTTGAGNDGSLARDAVARHAGVNPTVQNPYLFKDLLS